MRRRALAAAALVLGVLAIGLNEATVAGAPHEAAPAAEYLAQVIESDRPRLAAIRDVPADLAAALDALAPKLERLGEAAASAACDDLVPATTAALPAVAGAREALDGDGALPPAERRFLAPLLTQVVVYGGEILAAC